MARRNGKLSQRQLQIDERHIEALRLRVVDGKTFGEIAKILSYDSPSSARYAVSIAAHKTVPAVEAEAARQAMVAEIEAVADKLWERIMGAEANILLIGDWLKAKKQLATLQGLDMPVKVAQTAPDGSPASNVLRVIIHKGTEVEVVDGQPISPRLVSPEEDS